jgi:hypothetical protein
MRRCRRRLGAGVEAQADAGVLQLDGEADLRGAQVWEEKIGSRRVGRADANTLSTDSGKD